MWKNGMLKYLKSHKTVINHSKKVVNLMAKITKQDAS